MIVHTMSPEEMVADGRKDFAALYNRTDKPLRLARREMIKTRQDVMHLLPWRSPRNNNWLLLVQQRKAGPRIYALAWYYDRDGRINALHMAQRGMVFHLHRHVIERYGDRFDPTAKPLERLQSFWLENHAYSVNPVDKRSEDRYNVQVGMNHGMGLGSWDLGTEIVHVETFINHGQMFTNQLDTMERMDVERMLRDLTPGQRRFFVAHYKRLFPQDAGTPGMEWLEGFAA